MSDFSPNSVENFFQKPDIHQKWENLYRSKENEDFYDLLFDKCLKKIKPPKDALFLDAGCGSASHSIRLAQRGFQVKAVDFSEKVLDIAQKKIKDLNLDSKIETQRENNCDLSFENNSFPYVLCWGVLMHIPEFEKAIDELARVLKPGGHLIISENNKDSLEAKIIKLFKNEKNVEKHMPYGVEFWGSDESGQLVVRFVDIEWLIDRFQKAGLILEHRFAGQFSEAYIRFSSTFLQRLVHGLNKFWFKIIRNSNLAFGNILIFKKPD